MLSFAAKTTLLAVTICCGSASEECLSINDEVSFLQEKTNLRVAIKDGDPGSADCPCIGVDHVGGHVVGDVKGKKVDYPADLGAHCAAWDSKGTPGCPGKPWCEAKWCYVDPCNCKNQKALPKPSEYLHGAQYMGHAVYFSYATCGSTDTYSTPNSGEARQKRIDQSCSKQVDASTWGNEKCRCVGLAPTDGVTKVTLGGKPADFPADTGAQCQAWEKDNDPACKVDSPPSYCTEKWCYVNSDECDLPVAPKPSNYLPDSTIDGKPVYYSYSTCGGSDSWAPKAISYGNADCPCVGVDHVPGHVFGTVGGKKVSYPADLGAHCEAWDAKSTPGCPGASWCSMKWCYVDPCNCKNVAALPKPSEYLAGAENAGHAVYFSYATCGAKDTYSKADSDENRQKRIDQSCSKKVAAAKWGNDKCRCVGFAPTEGTVKVTLGGKQVDYPADTGAECEAWEKDNDPACKGASPPDYCTQKWCYVNPDECDLPGGAPQPKTSSYLPDSTIDGKPVHYSYGTCGGTDSWTTSQTSFGNSDCPCIGVDHLKGGVFGDVGGKSVTYPADLGAHCNAWDASRTPGCPGQPWCDKLWCYVDACNCKNVGALPKPSHYLSGSQYRGHSVYYSYATCGSKDSYSGASSEENRQKRIDQSCSKKVDDSVWGNPKCRCTGIAPRFGEEEVKLGGKTAYFPADTGADCQAWEKDHDPACLGAKAPAYCTEKWCYVNPSDCDSPVAPKPSSYLPDSSVDGNKVYFSYATCGGTDSWTTSTISKQTRAEAGKAQGLLMKEEHKRFQKVLAKLKSEKKTVKKHEHKKHVKKAEDMLSKKSEEKSDEAEEQKSAATQLSASIFLCFAALIIRS